MTATAQRTRTAKPATLTGFRLLEKPIYHCDLLPEGLPGTVEFNGSTYTVLPLGSGSRDGYRVENLDNGKVYDVDTSTGYPACDCPDFLVRRGKTKDSCCKHCLALIRMRKLGQI